MNGILVLALCTPAAGTSLQPVQPGTPADDRAAALVRQLGHPTFAIRETAAKQLVELGAAAVPALQAGLKDDDAEVRARSTALLPQALAAEWRRRADAYQADTEGKQAHDLPLLAEWERITGKADAGSRRLFADMVRGSGSLLDAAATDPRTAPVRIAQRAAELLPAAGGFPGSDAKAAVADVAALLLAQAIAEAGQPSAAGRARAPAFLLLAPAVTAAADDREIGPAFRRLLAGWAASRPASDGDAAGCFVHLALFHPLPEGAVALARVTRELAGGTAAVEALTALGRAGGPAARAELERLLDNDSSLWAKARLRPPQVREGVLAELARLAGRDPKDYGLVEKHRWVRRDGAGGKVDVVVYQSATDDDRAAGLARWRREAGGPPKN